MMAWRLIETAPKDGTKMTVLLKDLPRRPFDDDQWRARITTAYFKREWDDEPGVWVLAVPSESWARDDECFPTHWMPLPDPPKEN